VAAAYINFKGGKISGPGSAIDILGIKHTSLYARIKTLGIREQFIILRLQMVLGKFIFFQCYKFYASKA
jgi:hypothetical protein